jgi:restriction system protein
MPRYSELAEKRLRANWAVNRKNTSEKCFYKQPEDYGYDFRGFVSPYTKSAGNTNADIFLTLQDWASHDALTQAVDPDIQRYGHDPKRVTNKRLKELLMRVFGVRLN